MVRLLHVGMHRNRTLATRGCYYATAKFETMKCQSCAGARGSGCIVFRLVENLFYSCRYNAEVNSHAVLRDENLDNFFYHPTLQLF